MEKQKIVTFILGLTMSFIVNAQTALNNEPILTPNALGLVYEGAISENKANKVNIHKVHYKIEGIDVCANLYTPAKYDANKLYKAVVVAHPNGGSKDQVAGLYAQKIAEAGFISLAFDARFQGESGGEPRLTDKPYYRMGDISGAIDFLQTYPGVDKANIGVFGICGGGGYSFASAQADKRIKAVATLSLFNTGDVRRNGYMRSQTSKVFDVQNDIAKEKEALGAEPQVMSFANMTAEQAMQLPVDLYREGFFYYAITHKTPNATGAYLKSSLMETIVWDATDRANLITQPLLMIAGDKADSKYMTEEAFNKATGTKDKELFIIPNATHIKTYYIAEYVEQITNKITQFFKTKL